MSEDSKDRSSVSTEGAKDRALLFTEAAKEAAGFYNLVVTVASSFLGGTLLFLEKIAHTTTLLSLVCLGVGWLCLTGSILSIAVVRRWNMESAYFSLEEKWDEAVKIDIRTRKWSTAAVHLMALGILFVAGFGMINLVHAQAMAKEQNMSESKVDPRTQPTPQQESIPFGSLRPGAVQPGNQTPTGPGEIPSGPSGQDQTISGTHSGQDAGSQGSSGGDESGK